MNSTPKNIRYDNINGLRALSAIGIAMMHYQANSRLAPDMGFVTSLLIPWFTNLVMLFLIISSFSVCCGYYERMKNGSISPNDFYTKRYWRILPFFAFLSIIDVVLNFSKISLAQGFMNCTLVFGLLPKSSFDVIGVGWFIGLIFLFYMLFPFFVFLIDNKTRAWAVFSVSLVINFLCQEYFFTESVINWNPGRINILYSASFLIAGGLCFLYKDFLHDIAARLGNWLLFVCIAANILYFLIPQSKWTLHCVIPMLVVCSLWLIYAVGNRHKWMQNRVFNFLSNISLEIYLCHMIFFRIIEKLNPENYIADANIRYLVVCVTGIGATVVFSYYAKKVIGILTSAAIKRRALK